MTTNPPTDRDRIAEALYAHSHPGWATRYTDLDRDERETYLARAEAVLAALPEPADRAAVLTAAERTMLTYALDQAQEHIWSRDGFTDEDQAAVTSLRRMAVEARQQPDTETGAVSRQTLVGLIRDFRDPDPCQLDHHGYCQAHVWMCSGSPCPHARAREVLAAIDAEEAAVSGPGRVADEEPAEPGEWYRTAGFDQHDDYRTDVPAVSGPRAADDKQDGARRCSHNDIVYGLCTLDSGHDGDCLHEHQPKPEVVHACPPDGSGLTPCCRRTPFELPLTDRISSEAPITCPGAVVSQPGKET